MRTTSTRAKNSTAGKAKTSSKSAAGSKSTGGGNPSGRAWKLERASVTRKGENRPRSNKYSDGDNDKRPEAGDRTRAWVGGYTRADGKKVKGHYRELAHSGGTGSGVRSKKGSGGSSAAEGRGRDRSKTRGAGRSAQDTAGTQ